MFDWCCITCGLCLRCNCVGATLASGLAVVSCCVLCSSLPIVCGFVALVALVFCVWFVV